MKRALLPCLAILLASSSCAAKKFAEASGGQAETYSIKVGGEPESANDDPESANADPAAETVADSGKGAGEDKKNGGGGGESAGKDKDKDAEECGKFLGVKSDSIKVSGSNKDISVSKGGVLALKVTGNSNEVKIDLTEVEADSQLAGICLFIAGNQNKVSIQLATGLESLLVKARGNQPSVEIDVAKGATLGKVDLDAAGNGSQLVMRGEGTYPCDAKDVICE